MCRLNCIYVFVICVITSCCTNDKLNQALSLSGDNRSELEKVLKYYRENGDPLKLKAAIFLIENMPGHHSYTGDAVKKWYKDLDQILNMDTTANYKNDAIKSLACNYSNVSFQEEEDIKIITADFLIHNIEKSFDLWKNGQRVKHVSFEQFCELLLPYKCFEYQEFDNWRDTLSMRFNNTLNTILEDDQFNTSSYYAAALINGEINASYWGTKEAATKKSIGLPFLNSSIYKVSYEDCYGSAMLATMVLRSHGLPVVMDYIPQWGRKEGRHAWHTLLSDNGTFLPFSWGLTSNPGDVFFPYDPIPKVYRITYTANEKIARYLKEAVYKHPFFEMFEQDITQEYIRTSDISVPLINNKSKDKYAYLAVFDNQSWSVVDLGISTASKAEFQNVGRDIVYLVLGYDGTALVPISHSFLLNKNGELQYFNADKTKKNNVCLLRKYPKNSGVANMEHRIIGGEIHASNDKDFSQYELLYRIADFSYPDMIPLNVNKEYRYWRYFSKNESHCNIAELQFFEENSDCPVSGKIIGTEKAYQNDPNRVREKVFDGDWLTYFDAEQPNDCWVGLDLGRKTIIDRVRCIPRSDDNAIHYGDMYELKYWDLMGWKSLEIQEAKDRFLYFDSVPNNALLLLSNRTRGSQERIFIYQNNRQVWW